ncbi:hypothetical protein [Actinoplanes sp. HUAS TT8]|uniref:hypothetical protein n=1 Tax=Actinoplanes sp. HUAS TT8 TaxID=3447453 RepID=UPI003F51F8BC
MTVDLGDPVPGWVDLLWLPDEPEQWPAVGRSGFFEVIRHRGHEIRLEPLDAGMRGRRCRWWRCGGPQWAAVTARWPVGSLIEATVESVSPNDRLLGVRFAGWFEFVEYEGTPLEPGARVHLRVESQSEWTRSFVLALV